MCCLPLSLSPSLCPPDLTVSLSTTAEPDTSHDQPGQWAGCGSPHHRHHDSPRYFIQCRAKWENVKDQLYHYYFSFEAGILLFLDIEYPANSGQMGKTLTQIALRNHLPTRISGISTLIENLERKKALSEKAQ